MKVIGSRFQGLNHSFADQPYLLELVLLLLSWSLVYDSSHFNHQVIYLNSSEIDYWLLILIILPYGPVNVFLMFLSFSDYSPKILDLKIWHDGQNCFSDKFGTAGKILFSTNLGRRVRIFNEKFGTTGKIVFTNLGWQERIIFDKWVRRARFFFDKFGTTGKIL